MTTIARRDWRYVRDVVGVLVDRDLKMMYKRSTLGLLWGLAHPLMQLVVFTVVFRRVIRVDVPAYASFVFIGVLVWNWFHSALAGSTSLITGSRALVRQPGFPLTLLPIVTVGVRLIHFAMAIPLLAVLLLVQGMAPSPAWLFLPVLVVVQFVFTAALAYPLAALNVQIRDTQHVVAVVLQLTMYLTPIFYDAASLPESLRRWYVLNPMVTLIGAWRDVLLYGRVPALGPLAVIALLAAGMMWAGRRIFIAESHRFVEEL